MNIDVSIFLPVLNAKKYLNNWRRLASSLPNNFEFVVVDSTSTDGTFEFFREIKTITAYQFPLEDFDHGRTRSKARDLTKGSLICYVTQDSVIDDWSPVHILSESFNNNSKIGCAYGKQIPHIDANLNAQHLRSYNYSQQSYTVGLNLDDPSVSNKAFLSNSFSMFRRSALDSISWFPENIIWGEDTYAAYLLIINDWLVHYNSEAIVRHSHNYNIKEEFNRSFDAGVFHASYKSLNSDLKSDGINPFDYLYSGFIFYKQRRSLIYFYKFIAAFLSKSMGYLMGKFYKHIPKYLVIKFSLNKKYWHKK